MKPFARRAGWPHIGFVLNLISLIVGGVALLLAIPAFLPLLGWLNWVVVPLALLGLGLGVASRRKSGRNLNLVVIVVSILRLMLGGGIL
jgi:predicted permease